MVLESLPSGNNVFMKSFLKNELEYKTYKKRLNQLKNVPRNYTFLILFLKIQT